MCVGVGVRETERESVCVHAFFLGECGLCLVRVVCVFCVELVG